MEMRRPLRVGLVAVCAVALAGCLLTAWGFFFGNPVVRIGMRSRVTRYLQAKYPTTEFAYLGTSYDFLIQRQYSSGVRATKADVSFGVVSDARGVVTDDYLERKLAKELAAAVTPIVRSVLPTASVSADIRLIEGRIYPESLTYAEGVADWDSISVSWDSTDADKGRFVDNVGGVLAALQKAGLTVNRYYFWNELGDREYAVDLDGKGPDLSREQLMDLVAQPGKW